MNNTFHQVLKSNSCTQVKTVYSMTPTLKTKSRLRLMLTCVLSDLTRSWIVRSEIVNLKRWGFYKNNRQVILFLLLSVDNATSVILCIIYEHHFKTSICNNATSVIFMNTTLKHQCDNATSVIFCIISEHVFFFFKRQGLKVFFFYNT